jgi:hypothetical protein
MSNEADSADETSEPIGGMPDADNVRSRAEGRPPEEQSSEDPAAQHKLRPFCKDPRTASQQVQRAQNRSLNRYPRSPGR